MIHPSRVEAFGAWYAQVSAAAETPIAELVESFEAGVTPEEMNAR